MSRYVLAAHYVRSCDTVVEIGGFKTPITRFLTRVPRRVLVVDPLIQPFDDTQLHGEPCRVQHHANTFQTESFDLAPGSYGLVLLGASMKHFSDDPAPRAREWRKLVDLLREARVVVLEFAVAWALGRNHVEDLVRDSRLHVRLRLDLDLGACPGVETEHSQRRLLVLERDAGPGAQHG
jgi:hypothetical protein